MFIIGHGGQVNLVVFWREKIDNELVELVVHVWLELKRSELACSFFERFPLMKSVNLRSKYNRKLRYRTMLYLKHVMYSPIVRRHFV